MVIILQTVIGGGGDLFLMSEDLGEGSQIIPHLHFFCCCCCWGFLAGGGIRNKYRVQRVISIIHVMNGITGYKIEAGVGEEATSMTCVMLMMMMMGMMIVSQTMKEEWGRRHL